jgi:hypothetical protein
MASNHNPAPTALSARSEESGRAFLSQRLLRESLIFLGFVALTALMTWPWVLHLRNAVADEGDSYAHAYFLWWDYHQTFHDPLHLFHATIFYPYHYTLAFGENDYGISLLFFPLFALGLRPLTVYSVAAFLSFPFTGYGAFRLARTLSGSSAIAWVAGIVFAFIPYRFEHLSHLPLIFAGWIPLLFEALVLFARKRSWTRALWLGLAFVMNALTSLTWFILTLIPLGLSAIILASREGVWRDRAFWVRASTALCLAALVLLPFLLPYAHVAQLNGFVRTAAEVQMYSARPVNWLAAPAVNRLWHGLGAAGADYEMVLFPGLLPLLLTLAAFLLVKPQSDPRSDSDESYRTTFSFRKGLLFFLDSFVIVSGIVAILAIGYDPHKLRLIGSPILAPARALLVCVVALVIRCAIAYPHAFRNLMSAHKSPIEKVRLGQHTQLLAHGFVWAAVGFMGSFGLNFFFHRVLYEFVTVFRSMRVAVRWAMICYLGLALLAGLGASRFAAALSRHWPRLRTSLTFGVLILVILFEQRVAPLPLVLGEADADGLALYLKTKKMTGGIVELPAGDNNHRYMLRAADHGRPLVTARNSFSPPLEEEIESLTMSRPIPDHLLDLLETIPASYVTVHNSLISPEGRLAIETLLDRGITAGRLRFIKSFERTSRYSTRERNDLYAVTKNEPEAQAEGPRPPPLSYEGLAPLFSGLLADFQQTGFFVYRFDKVAYGRAPLFAEFMPDVQLLKYDPARGAEKLEDSKRAFAEGWMNRPEFKSRYGQMSDEQYVDALLTQAGLTSAEGQRDKLLDGLHNGAMTRAAVLRNVADNNFFAVREFNSAFVVMHYFAYLQRDPDEAGYNFWLRNLNRFADHRSFTEAFAAATERQLKLNQP